MNTRRDRVEIVFDILRSIQEKKTKMKPTHLLYKSNLSYKYKTIVNGDASVLSIACASIIAKVTRDRMMVEYDKSYPEYGFRKHKGYPTAQHKQALRQFGPSKIHRKSFKY